MRFRNYCPQAYERLPSLTAMWKINHSMRVILLSCIALCGAAAMLAFALKSPNALLFERHVISPIPESVRRIEADQVYSLSRRLTATGEYSLYVLRFDVGSEDVERIITSNAMTEWPSVRYDFGGLYYTTFNGVEIDIHLYSVTRPKPNWFDLPKWKSFTTYYWGDEGAGNSWERARLLLYNEQLGQAYFIKKDITGL